MANFAQLIAATQPTAQYVLTDVNDYATLRWIGPGAAPTRAALLAQNAAVDAALAARDSARRAVHGRVETDATTRGRMRTGTRDPEAIADAAITEIVPVTNGARTPARITTALRNAGAT